MKPDWSWYSAVHVISGMEYTNRRGIGARFIYPKYREKWWRALGAIVRCPPKDWNKERRYTLEIIRIMRPKQRAFDKANFEHGCKPILDYFRHKDVGWLKDDTPRWLNDKYDQLIWKEAQIAGYSKPGTYINFWKGDSDG